MGFFAWSQTRFFARTALAATFFFALSAAPRAQESRRAAPDIRFTVSMPAPHTHLLEVEMRVRAANASPRADLVMPVWTPGSYLVREFARHVQDFEARDASGRELRWSKTNKNTWRVETAGAREWRVSYRVYANELSVRTNSLDDRRALWNNAALLMYLDGHLRAPATVRVVPFKNWKVATGLPSVAGEADTFRAENFDVLYDSPFLVSDFKEFRFTSRGRPHRFVVEGEGNYDLERLRRDVPKIVEAAQSVFGDAPYDEYTFMTLAAPAGGGGLEHLNSTVMIYTRFGFRPDTGSTSYQNFLTLVAHEFFHLWNVKRIRPDALGPFDYTRENYTTLLWWAEGATDYYERLLLRRAGLMSEKEFLDAWASSIQDLQSRPGRLEQSIEESSFDAWIKYYRRDENWINSQVSYYDKGGIVSLLLDLEIRRRSGGRASLDDVMRALYEEFGKRGRNFTPADLQRVSERAAGSSLEEFFARYVRGRDELDYDAALAAAGLRLDTGGGGTPPAPAQKAFLGATLALASEVVTLTAVQGSGTFRTTVSPDAAVVKSIPAGTPAYDAGLNVGDQIVALDGFRVTRDTFERRLDERRPGDSVALTVFRGDELRTFNVRLAARPDASYRIVPLAQPTDEQRRLYQSWLGTQPSAAR
ncbi:MAG TPA: PDZ domain-containing protein [Pyrinomonadaceae bacterium]|nr:PDZ domain-containing protein [Pyrinomonadaceae bacterium]